MKTNHRRNFKARTTTKITDWFYAEKKSEFSDVFLTEDIHGCSDPIRSKSAAKKHLERRIRHKDNVKVREIQKNIELILDEESIE